MQGFHRVAAVGLVAGTLTCSSVDNRLLPPESHIHISILTHNGQFCPPPSPFITSLRHSAAEKKEINWCSGTRERMQGLGGWRRGGELQGLLTAVSVCAHSDRGCTLRLRCMQLFFFSPPCGSMEADQMHGCSITV